MSKAAHSTRVCLFVAITLCLANGPAIAISLGALTEGASLTSDDGAVRFSGFSVSFLAGIVEERNSLNDLDLRLVDVQVITQDDRRILAFEGGIEVSFGALGQMWIDYTVETGDGFSITGADLSLKAEAPTMFSGVTVVETILGDAAASLVARERYDGTGIPSGAEAFAQPVHSLEVGNDLFLDGGFGGTTRVASLQQGFRVARSVSPVPEPGAALLFGTGALIAAARLRSKAH
jgi:hypothetical protein